MDIDLKGKIREWLKDKALPLWFEHGIAPDGSFFENLSRAGRPIPGSQRAMVQGRQIYAFAEAVRLDMVPRETLEKVLHKAGSRLIERYSLPNGGFAHSIDINKVQNPQADLYAQGFALFGLAHAYEITKEPQFRARALQLLNYLYEERRLPGGMGFSEIIKGVVAFEANPHMHLFEAALAWIKADPDEHEWRALADEVSGLCVGRFVDKDSLALCEHFDSKWHPLRESGNFVFEPGHHYEWAWLLLQYQDLTGASAGHIPHQLYKVAERTGVDPKSGLAVDEVWSHGQVKKRSSRFWPQSERIKAAVALAPEADSKAETESFHRVADQAVLALFKFLDPVLPGLWEDTLQENGQFTDQPIKASSLYHIICAFSEYLRKR